LKEKLRLRQRLAGNPHNLAVPVSFGSTLLGQHIGVDVSTGERELNGKMNDEELTMRNRCVFAEHKCTENKFTDNQCTERTVFTKSL
jgi:hypothetical protein